MSTTPETPRDLRKKLSRAAVSHKSLKDKQREKQYDLKILKNKLSSVRANRDKWRLLCKDSETRAKKLELELNKTSQQRDNLLAKIQTADVSVSKKKQ